MTAFARGQLGGVTTLLPVNVRDQGLDKPMFTFSDREDLRDICTGNLTQMRQLVQGHEVEEVGMGMYIPFVNNNHLSDDPMFRDRDLAYKTNMDQAVHHFGVKASRILSH